MTKSVLFAKSSVIWTHFCVISRHFWVRLHKKYPFLSKKREFINSFLPWNPKLYSAIFTLSVYSPHWCATIIDFLFTRGLKALDIICLVRMQVREKRELWKCVRLLTRGRGDFSLIAVRTQWILFFAIVKFFMFISVLKRRQKLLVFQKLGFLFCGEFECASFPRFSGVNNCCKY